MKFDKPVNINDFFNYRSYCSLLWTILREIEKNTQSAEESLEEYLSNSKHRFDHYQLAFYKIYGKTSLNNAAVLLIGEIISLELQYPDLVEYKKGMTYNFDEELIKLQNKEKKTREENEKLNNMQSALSVVYDNPALSTAAYHTLVEFGEGLKGYTDQLQQIQCQLGGHGYNLALMSDKIKPEKGIFYVRIKDNALEYRVITPEGNEVTDKIEKNELDNVLGSKQSTQLMNSNFKPTNLKPFLSKILAITSERGHTQKGGPYETQYNQLEDNITKLKNLQLSIKRATDQTDSDNPPAYGSHLQHCIKEFNLVQRDLKTIDLPETACKQLQSDTSSFVTRIVNTIRSWLRLDNKKQTETEPQLPKKYAKNLEFVGVFHSINDKVKSKESELKFVLTRASLGA